MGIEDSLVYTVPVNDIGVVVHRCEAKPYTTQDREKAGEWILTHQSIIDLATRFGTVIPLTFDTIFKGDDEAVKQWLRDEYHELKTTLKKLKGKAEYGVQVFVENDFFEKATKENEEIERLKKEIENKPKGAAYLLRKKLEKRLELERKALADKHAWSIYKQIEKLVDDVKLDSTKKEVPEKWKGKRMILNLACLAHKDKIQNLGNTLGEVNEKDGFAVRFTGPWPPYSFVGEIGRSKSKEVK